MESKVSYFINSERALSQLKHWLKSVHRLSIEEFVILYKVYEAKKMSGKELRDTLHFEMLWDTSKIDVIIRKISSFLKCVQKRMKDKFFIIIMIYRVNY